MKILGITAALASLLLADAAHSATVRFREDFNGTSLQSSVWSVGNWTLGRSPLGNTPIIANGMARLPFDTYRFRGSEIYTTRTFSRGTGLEVEARCRLNRLPSGLITSLFTYIFDGTTLTSDEIDIEMLTKQVNLSSGGSPVTFTTFNNWPRGSTAYMDGIHHWSVTAKVPGLDVNQWHSYVIRWLPDRTEWLIDGKIVATSTKARPDAAQAVHLDIWAPASDWPDAYDASLKPATSSANNHRYYFDVDYVEVRSLP